MWARAHRGVMHCAEGANQKDESVGEEASTRGLQGTPSRTKRWSRRPTAYASLQLSGAAHRQRWAPRARGGKTKRMLPRPAGPAPPGRASLHGWEPYPTRDGAPPPRAGSPQRGGAPLHGQGRSSMGCTTRPDLRPLGSAHHLLRRGPAGAAERVRPGAWVVSSSRACVWRSLASLPRRRASACIWAGSHGLASQGPQQAGHTGHGARRRGTREATAAEAVACPTRPCGRRVRPGRGFPRRGGVVWWVVVGRGGRGVQANPSASTSAQPGLAPDGLQPALVPRCGFRPQVKPSVGQLQRCLRRR